MDLVQERIYLEASGKAGGCGSSCLILGFSRRKVHHRCVLNVRLIQLVAQSSPLCKDNHITSVVVRTSTD